MIGVLFYLSWKKHSTKLPSQFEATRLVLIQTQLKMDLLVSLHLYVPICALINLCLLPFTQGAEPLHVVWLKGYWHEGLGIHTSLKAINAFDMGQKLPLADNYSARSLWLLGMRI